MALDTKDLETILDIFNTKTKYLLLQISTETNMEDEHFATVTSETIKNSFDSSVRALQIYKQNELVDQQILAEQIKNGGLHFTYTYNENGTIATKTLANGTTKSLYEVQKEVEEARIKNLEKEDELKQAQKDGVISETIIKQQQSTKDTELKDLQITAEKLKTGGLNYTYTYYLATDAEVVAGTNFVGQIKSKTLNNGITKSIYELEMDTERNRANGFIDNLRIKRAEHLGNTIFGLGAGGLKPNASLWGQYFTALNNITSQSSSTINTTGIDVE